MIEMSQVLQLGVRLPLVREGLQEPGAAGDLKQQVRQLRVGQHRVLAAAQPQQAVGLLERVELLQVEPPVGDLKDRMVAAQPLLGAGVGRVELRQKLADELASGPGAGRATGTSLALTPSTSGRRAGSCADRPTGPSG